MGVTPVKRFRAEEDRRSAVVPTVRLCSRELLARLAPKGCDPKTVRLCSRELLARLPPKGCDPKTVRLCSREMLVRRQRPATNGRAAITVQLAQRAGRFPWLPAQPFAGSAGRRGKAGLLTRSGSKAARLTPSSPLVIVGCSFPPTFPANRALWFFQEVLPFPSAHLHSAVGQNPAGLSGDGCTPGCGAGALRQCSFSTADAVTAGTSVGDSPSCASQRSASSAAMQPVPAAVTACL